ncbi:RHS repeat-associated core domain-containing protein, partial [Brevibacillus parabrevis]|uniref:RHS repeat-associated core domain-containing protein n=1 Tax=Brevibacillus parabrevis TaxID=54914 RepID=UPI0028536105
RSAVSGSAPSMRVDYSYDSADRLSSVTIPSVGTTTYTYDIKSSGETNTVSYPGQPNAMQKTMSSFAEITGINHADGWSETNGYDLFGNITSQKRGGAIYGTFAYDKLSRIKEETIQGNTRQYAYDRRGNRQAYANAPADSTRSYELKHDLFNRLTEYKDDKGTTTYTYYPGGLRATKQQTGAVTDTTHYVYLNGQVIEELTQDGRVKARNVFGNQLIWRKDYTTNQEGTYYYNSHGDVVKIKGPSGNALNTYEYDIWGNLIAEKVKETMPNPFTYGGEMYDKESGFYYLRARYYDPKMGRFISEDTYKGQVENPLSLNRYTYVSNNPIKYIDPSGHAQCQGAHNCGRDGESRLHYLYQSTKNMTLDQALTIVTSNKQFSEGTVMVALGTVFMSAIGPDGGAAWLKNAKNINQIAKYREILKTWQDATPLIESLRDTGKLPSNYITKAQAEAYGWKAGKAVGSWVKDIPNAQIGGDIFDNVDGGKFILPMVNGRVWYEADVGLVNTMGRNNQPGTRLLYSNDGEMWITTDHYDNFYYIGSYWDKANMT